MPPLPVVPNVMKFKLTYSDGSNTNVENQFYLKYSGSVSATDLATLLNTIGIAWSAQMAPLTGPWLVLESIEGTDLGTKTGAQAVEDVSIAGTNTSTNKLSSGAAAVISKLESDQYRGGHSRNYIPGIPDASLQNSNTWTAAFQSALAAAWSNFIHELITTSVPAAMGTLQDVVVHRFGQTAGSPVIVNGKLKSVPLTTPVVHLVTGYRTNPKVASQRRRNQQP
jgi:hypothetical protein